MAIRTVGWLGATRQSKLLEHVQHQVERWSEQWSISSKRFDLNIASDDQKKSADHRQLTFRCSTGLIVVRHSAGFLPRLAQWLTSTKPAQTHGLADRVALRALKALVQQISGAPSIDLLNEESNEPIKEQFSFSPIFRLSLADIEMHIRISDELIYTLAPKRTAKTIPLNGKHALIADQLVSIKLFLPMGNMSLKDIKDLQVGEVLGLNSKLDDVLQVVSENNKPIANVSIQNSESLQTLLIDKTNF
jgi:hypothetical protein